MMPALVPPKTTTSACCGGAASAARLPEGPLINTVEQNKDRKHATLLDIASRSGVRGDEAIGGPSPSPPMIIQSYANRLRIELLDGMRNGRTAGTRSGYSWLLGSAPMRCKAVRCVAQRRVGVVTDRCFVFNKSSELNVACSVGPSMAVGFRNLRRFDGLRCPGSLPPS